MPDSMTHKNPLWKKFLNGINILRLLIVNFVFFGMLGLIAIIVLIVVVSSQEPNFTDSRILWLSPSGFIVDNYSSNDFQRELNHVMDVPDGEVLLSDILAAIDTAASDKRIKGLYLDLSMLFGASLSSVHEIQTSILHFKEAGKKVYAYSPSFYQTSYSLCAAADHISMDPYGQLKFHGFSMTQAYFKGGLEKLGVDINVFRAGEYKSFVEPFIRADMSNKVKDENQRWLNQIWDDYLDIISIRESVNPLFVKEYMDSYLEKSGLQGLASSEIALQGNLVDSVQYQDLFEEMITEDIFNKSMDFEDAYIHFSNYLNHIPHKTNPGKNNTVAVIVAEGDIIFGDGYYGSIGSSAFSELIYRVKDQGYKALVLRINSGGGSAHASELIRRSLAELREDGIPVVVSMGDAAASGGYWIANESDYIFAYPTTITGSIGVFTIIPSFQRGLEKWGGITFDSVETVEGGRQSQLGQNLTENERAQFQADVDWLYGKFIGLISENRSMEKNEILPLAGGRIWTGRDAVDNGLVDALGGWNEALEKAAELSGMDINFNFEYLVPDESFKKQFASNPIMKVLLKTQVTSGFINILFEKNKIHTLINMNDPMGQYAYVNIDYLKR